MSREHRNAAAATGLLLLLGTAACGDAPASPTVASAETPAAPTATAAASALTRYVDAQRAWVGCVRKQGHNIPDPDAKGHVDLGAYLAGAKIPKTDPGFVAAQRACADLHATIPAELEPRLPPLTPQQLEYRRQYAKCMRDNGMPTWPDPGPDGEWPLDGLGGELTPAEHDANQRALQICDPVLEGKPKAEYDPTKVVQG
ncbi:hypothetical protein [Catellatospora sichuanensis]|uniref:hypothetical protein n=1 Tax=Catellatospora sichuanensis TaxID=1969805 RepID=UPI0011838953|nr:hypothetical protein [Catellatospora sichuanensis]